MLVFLRKNHPQTLISDCAPSRCRSPGRRFEEERPQLWLPPAAASEAGGTASPSCDRRRRTPASRRDAGLARSEHRQLRNRSSLSEGLGISHLFTRLPVPSRGCGYLAAVLTRYAARFDLEFSPALIGYPHPCTETYLSTIFITLELRL